MTSKLRRTIVGVGIALGGAAPGCFGRTQVFDDSSRSRETDDGTTLPEPDASAPDAQTADAAPPERPDATDASVPTDGTPTFDATPDVDGSLLDAASDAALDAASDGAVDPFCDISWPPTKGSPQGPVPCIDPRGECTDMEAPRGCYPVIAPLTCHYVWATDGPLVCVNGKWECPPGTLRREQCTCMGPLPPGQTCTDAGPGEIDAGSGAEGGQGGT